MALPEVTSKLMADISDFVEGWNHAAEIATGDAQAIKAAEEEVSSSSGKMGGSAKKGGDDLRKLGDDAKRAGEDVMHGAEEGAEGAAHLGEGTAREADRASSALGSYRESATRAGEGTRSLGQGADEASNPLETFGTLLADTSAKAKVIAAVAPAAAGAAFAAGGALMSVATGAIVAKVGSDGIKQAFTQLGPAAGAMSQQVSQVFMKDLGPPVQEFSKMLPKITDGMKSVAGSMSGVVKGFADVVSSGEGVQAVNAILQGTAKFFDALKPGIQAVAQSMLTFGQTVAPELGKVGDAVSHLFEMWNAAIQKMAQNGDLVKAVDAGAKAVAALGDILKPVIEILGKLAATAGGPVADALSSLGTALSNAEPAFEAVGRAIGQLAQLIGPLLPPIGKLIGLIGDGLVTVLKAIQPLIDGISEILKSQFGEAIVAATALVWLFNAALDANPIVAAIVAIGLLVGAAKAIIDNWGKIAGFFKDLWSGITDVFGKAVDGIKGYLGKMWDNMKSAFSTGVNAVKDAWNGFWGWFESTFDKDGSIKQKAQKLWDDLGKLWNGGTQKLKDAANAFGSWVSDNWDKLMSKIGDVSKRGWDQIAGFFKDAGDKIGEIASNAWNSLGQGVQDIIKNVVGWFGDLPGKIVDAIGDLGKKMFDIGKNALQGLINGALDMVKDVINFFLDLADKIVHALMQGLGISSPSRVIADKVGKEIPAGVGVGVIENAHMATDAMRTLGGQVSGAFNPQFASGASGGASGAGGVTVLVKGGADSAAGTFVSNLIRNGHLQIQHTNLNGRRQ